VQRHRYPKLVEALINLISSKGIDIIPITMSGSALALHWLANLEKQSKSISMQSARITELTTTKKLINNLIVLAALA
jgi:hypothetical protein